jgi:hypothetical protein
MYGCLIIAVQLWQGAALLTQLEASLCSFTEASCIQTVDQVLRE